MDTKHADNARTEGDGVSYRGLGWSMAILAIVTLFCYAIVVGLFKFMESRAVAGDTPRAPLAAAQVQPAIEDGRMVGGPSSVPSLLVREPMNLKKFRDEEEHLLTSYGWVDQNAGVVRLPIDRAKALLLERSLLPVRGDAAKPGEAQPGGHK
jgi:hypothetical protein